jgi:hypothetical protein
LLRLVLVQGVGRMQLWAAVIIDEMPTSNINNPVQAGIWFNASHIANPVEASIRFNEEESDYYYYYYYYYYYTLCIANGGLRRP